MNKFVEKIQNNWKFINKYLLAIFLLHLIALFVPAVRQVLEDVFFSNAFYAMNIVLSSLFFIMAWLFLLYFFVIALLVFVVARFVFSKASGKKVKKTGSSESKSSLVEKMIPQYLSLFKKAMVFFEPIINNAYLFFYAFLSGWILSMVWNNNFNEFSAFRLSFFTFLSLLVLAFLVNAKIVRAKFLKLRKSEKAESSSL